MIYNLKQALIKNRPSRKQFVFFNTLSAIVLVAIHFNLVISRLLSTLSIDKEGFEFIIRSHSSYFNRIGQAEVAYYVVIGLFWSGVGIVAYLVLWAAANMAMEFRNFLIYETSYVHKSRLHDSLRVVTVRLLFALMVISLLIITIVYGMPLWFSLFAGAMFAPIGLPLFAMLLGALLGLALNLYLLWLFTKLFIRANRT